MTDSYNTYTIVNTVLSGILIKPLFILWIILLCLGRRRSDHARVGVTYLKAAMPFLFLTMLFYVVSDILWLLYYNDDWYYSFTDVMDLVKASSYTAFVSYLFERITDILFILCFVELGNGFLYIINGQRTTVQRVLRYIALAVALLMFALSLAHFGKITDVYVKYYKSEYDDDDYYTSDSDYDAYYEYSRGLKIVRSLSMAASVLFFVISLLLLAFGIVIVAKTHRNHVIKNSAVILLVAAILNFIRRLWSLIYNAAWVIPNKNMPYEAVQVVDPILNLWVFFIVLVLLYVICVRKQQGLWSTSQPWMHGAPPPALSGQPLPPMNQAWGQYPQQVVYVQPAPGFMPQGQPPQGWQGQPQMAPQQGGYYYNQAPPQQQPVQQQATGTGDLGQHQVANGFHQPQEVKA